MILLTRISNVFDAITDAGVGTIEHAEAVAWVLQLWLPHELSHIIAKEMIIL